jgi:RimJ/RimL family protein N-acetyltransferase
MSSIVTKRLTLTKSDGVGPHLKLMVQWLNDPVVVQYSEQRHQVHTEETQQEYIDDGPDIFREIHTHQGKFIGTITANIDRPNSVADVGILIGEKEEWSKGYGFEAWSAFCNHLLTHGMRKIEAGTMSRNRAMLKVFGKYGMNYEGCRHEHFWLENDKHTTDMLLYGKFHEAI